MAAPFTSRADATPAVRRTGAGGPVRRRRVAGGDGFVTEVRPTTRGKEAAGLFHPAPGR